jgi:hypothetical protein
MDVRPQSVQGRIGRRLPHARRPTDPAPGVTGPCLPELVSCIWASTLSAMDGLEPVLVSTKPPGIGAYVLG